MIPSNSELIQWLRDNSSGSHHPSAQAAHRLERALYLLRQITHDLPANKDWLNPDLEREANTLIALDRGTDWLNGIELNPAERDIAKNIPQLVTAIAGEQLVGVSLIQRRLRCSYNSAVALLSLAERVKIIGPENEDGRHPVITILTN